MKSTHGNARERTSTASRTDPEELSAMRRAASAKGLAARWGGARGKSRQVRVDEAAFDALMAVPERDRRRVASDAIIEAAARYAAGIDAPAAP